MPRRRIKTKRKDEQLSNSQFWDLILGKRLQDPTFYNAPFLSDQERRECWNIHKEHLIADWRENGIPGNRPGAWWTYSAPELLPDEVIYSDDFKEVDWLRKWNLLEPWEVKALEDQARLSSGINQPAKDINHEILDMELQAISMEKAGDNLDNIP